MTQLTTDFRDAYAIVNEDKVRLHYVIGGEGPALLLIPGYPQEKAPDAMLKVLLPFLIEEPA